MHTKFSNGSLISLVWWLLLRLLPHSLLLLLSFAIQLNCFCYCCRFYSLALDSGNQNASSSNVRRTKWKALKFVMQWRVTHAVTITTLFFWGVWRRWDAAHGCDFSAFPLAFYWQMAECVCVAQKAFVLEFPLYEQYSRFMTKWQLNSLTSLISYCVTAWLQLCV